MSVVPERELELAMVAPAQEPKAPPAGPGSGNKAEGPRVPKLSESAESKQAERLRAINRAPEPARELYKQGLLGQKEADKRRAPLRCSLRYAHALNAHVDRKEADKRRAVEVLLRDEEWRARSDRWIAETCRVNHHLVAEVREQLGELPAQPESPAPRTGRDGKQRKAKVPLFALAALTLLGCGARVVVDEGDGGGGSGSTVGSSSASTTTSTGTPSTCLADADCYPPQCWAASCVGDPATPQKPKLCEYAQAHDGLACDLPGDELGACVSGFCK